MATIATSVGIQPDGKFVLSAVVETSDGFDVGSLRLNPDGSNDIGYGFLGLRIYDLDFGGDDEFAAKLALDHLNRILIAGSASFAGASDHDYLAIRLENSDDTIFRSTFGGDLH